MNILYISALTGNRCAGLSYSIPRQVKAQADFDNVHWINLGFLDNVDLGYSFQTIKNKYSFKMNQLPPPFNNPDLVVFESLYIFSYFLIAKQLKKMKIPYIILPRCSLTKLAQNQKRIKKKLGNYLFFNNFVRNANAIQYLTDDEFKNSGREWNNNAIIIGNGTEKKSHTKTWTNPSIEKKGVFIGRLDINHKGLDLLLRACKEVAPLLSSNKIKLEIYGSDSKGSKIILTNLIKAYCLERLVSIHDPIFDEEKELKLLNSDFFLLTSRFEGHPMGLIEALSYGLPCIITKGTNMGDEVIRHNAGWVADTSVESITEKLKQLISEIDILPMKGKNALSLSQKYDWHELAKRAHTQYQELVATYKK